MAPEPAPMSGRYGDRRLGPQGLIAAGIVWIRTLEVAMLWWVIVVSVVVVGFALAWWTSGRPGKAMPPGQDSAAAQADGLRKYGPGQGRAGIPGTGGGPG